LSLHIHLNTYYVPLHCLEQSERPLYLSPIRSSLLVVPNVKHHQSEYDDDDNGDDKDDDDDKNDNNDDDDNNDGDV
jgi:hypothetical protein